MTTTSTRAEALAEQFEQVNATALAAVGAADDATWRRSSRDERWPVGFAAWHIADSNAAIMSLISAVASGQPLPPITVAMLDARNAENLARYGGCGREEAMALLRQNGTTTAGAIRQLSDEQLERTATLELLDGATMSVQQLIAVVLIGHAQHHLASLQAAA